MNPYTALGAVLLALGLFFGGEHVGHTRGVNAQQVKDQAQFDQINAGITAAKAKANEIYRQAQDANLALATERDQLKTTLEAERETNRVTTDSLRSKYSAASLRFKLTQNSGYGAGCGSAKAPGADSSVAAAPPVVQLPDKIAADLRQLTFDADTIVDNYRECYGYANKVR